MTDEIMKPTVFGSKFVSFCNGTTMHDKFFPTTNKRPYIMNEQGERVNVSILQVKMIQYGDKVRFLVEYIECE